MKVTDYEPDTVETFLNYIYADLDLAKDQDNLEILQENGLRLSHELIYAFQWLDALINQAPEASKEANK